MTEEIRESLRKRILGEIGGMQGLDDRKISKIIDGCIESEAKRLPLKEKIEIKKELFDGFRRFDVISDLLDDPDVTEVMVNGPEKIFYEKGGRVFRYEKSFSSRTALENLVTNIVSGVNRHINEARPIADARLSDGSRVHCIMYPVALDGPVLTIRKFCQKRFTMEGLIANGSISKEAAEYLKTLVEAKYNIFISGGTGSGKTTLLNSLSEYIAGDERVITIEDSAELQISGCDDLVRLETRARSAEGAEEIPIRELIRNALRMRPDRLIVGEIRGAEAIDMLSAMNTGHDGSLSTGHSNSPKDMLSRIETMVLMGMDMPLAAVRGQIASALDIIVQVARIRDGSRKVVSIEEVLPLEDGEIPLQTLFEYSEEGTDEGKIGGGLVYTGRKLRKREKLSRAGKMLLLEGSYTACPLRDFDKSYSGNALLPELSRPCGNLSGCGDSVYKP